jgi:hypothetical protein
MDVSNASAGEDLVDVDGEPEVESARKFGMEPGYGTTGLLLFRQS